MQEIRAAGADVAFCAGVDTPSCAGADAPSCAAADAAISAKATTHNAMTRDARRIELLIDVKASLPNVSVSLRTAPDVEQLWYHGNEIREPQQNDVIASIAAECDASSLIAGCHYALRLL